MTDTDHAQDRTRIAFHEAAHVTAGYALGLEIAGPATIVPADGLAGLCLIDLTLQLDGNGQRPPTPMHYRAEVTANVLCYLAGQHGAWQAHDLPAASNPPVAVARFTRHLELSARSIADRDGDPRPQDDYRRALDLLVRYHGPEQPALPWQHLELLDAEAGHLVTKLRRPITIIAKELLAHDQLDADRLLELCQRNVATALLPQWNRSAILTMTT
jgi:hypothetical protein